MKDIDSEYNNTHIAFAPKAATILVPERTLPLQGELTLSHEQKQVLISHLIEWMTTLDNRIASVQGVEEAVSIIQIGLENQKQHLILLMDRLGYAALKMSAIHALQETSEALGKECALVRYYLCALGFNSELGIHDIITTEIRYYILKDILNLCGGTYLFQPDPETYLPPSESKPAPALSNTVPVPKTRHIVRPTCKPIEDLIYA